MFRRAVSSLARVAQRGVAVPEFHNVEEMKKMAPVGIHLARSFAAQPAAAPETATGKVTQVRHINYGAICMK